MKQLMICLLETDNKESVIACADLIYYIDCAAFLSSALLLAHQCSDGKIVNI